MLTRNQGITTSYAVGRVSVNKTYVTRRENFFLRFHNCLGAYQRLYCFVYYITKTMSPIQVAAALRKKAALIAASKEQSRDLMYLRQAGSKGIAV